MSFFVFFVWFFDFCFFFVSFFSSSEGRYSSSVRTVGHHTKLHLPAALSQGCSNKSLIVARSFGRFFSMMRKKFFKSINRTDNRSMTVLFVHNLRENQFARYICYLGPHSHF